MHTKSRKVIPVANVEFRVKLVLAAVVLSFLLWATNGHADDRVTTIRLDWAYYNPLSLVLKDKKWLEDEFQNDGIEIQWTQSLGSNKALELLRSKSVDKIRRHPGKIHGSPSSGAIKEFIIIIPRIHIDGQPPLLEVAHATDFECALLGCSQCRQQQRRQNGDDGDHHQQFNQSERFLWLVTLIICV